jgi:hypothetical protein
VYPMNPDLDYARSRMAERLRRAEQARAVAEARRQPVAVQAVEPPPLAEPIAAVGVPCSEAAVEAGCKTANADRAA